jgi:alpha-1,6-mannosyltransferase
MSRRGAWGWVLASLAGHALLAYGTARTDSLPLLLTWGTLFVLYLLLVLRPVEKNNFVLWVGAAVGFRLLWWLALPALSDDLYRFIWDGRLLAHGHNPFQYLPAELVGTPLAREAGLSQVLFAKLNSPAYYTVYPPLLQAWFGVAAALGGSLYGTLLLLKLPILLAELGSLALIHQLVRQQQGSTLPARRAVLLYGLNPLVLAELTGNVHFEAVAIFFLLASLYCWHRSQLNRSALLLGGAVGVKLLPLIFLPLLISRLPLRRQAGYVALVGLGVLLPFVPFWSPELGPHLTDSLGLYFQKFELNAGLYYLLRAAGTWLVGYNPIGTLGPLLSLLSFSGILVLSFYKKLPFSLYERTLLILTVYLLCATTVHPWYVTPLVALGVLTRFRFALLWSALLPLTYLAYGQVPFAENGWVVALEYLLVVGWLGWEVYKVKERKSERGDVAPVGE